MRVVSMIVDDRDLGGAGVGPSELNAPLVVDPDGVEALEAATEALQTIPRRNRQIAEDTGLVHLD